MLGKQSETIPKFGVQFLPRGFWGYAKGAKIEFFDLDKTSIVI
jgi:hypothetical protein